MIIFLFHGNILERKTILKLHHGVLWVPVPKIQVLPFEKMHLGSPSNLYAPLNSLSVPFFPKSPWTLELQTTKLIHDVTPNFKQQFD